MRIFRPRISESLFWLCWILCFLCSVSHADSLTTKPLRIVIDDNYPPFTFRDPNGKLQGISIDYWHLWENRTGTPIIIEGMDWSEALRLMSAGEYDIIETIFQNDERNLIYDFSKPYAQIEVPIFFNQNISGITGVESLKGFVVAVKSGDAAISYLRSHGVEQLVEYNSYEAIIEAVKAQKVVVFCIDKPPALYYLYKMGLQSQFRYTNPLYIGEFHRAVKKGNSALLQKIENGFSLIDPAEYRAIERKWYGTETKYKEYLKYFAFIVSIVGLLVVILIIWNRTLRRTVEQRTAELKRILVQSNQQSEALRESEEQLRTLINSLPDIVIFKDAECRWIEANNFVLSLYGIDPSSYRYHTDTEFADLIPTHRSTFLRATITDEQCFISGSPIRFDAIIPFPNGWDLIFDIIKVPMFFPDGSRKGIVIIGRDITQRKHIENALRESEEKYRILLEESTDPIFSFNRDGSYRYVNNAFASAFGAKPEQITGKKIWDIFSFEEANRRFEAVRQVFESGVTSFIEGKVPTTNGSSFYLTTITPIKNDSGEVLSVLCIAKDISQRKEAEDALRAKTVELDRYFSSSLDLLCIADTGGHFRRLNPEWEKTLGYSLSELEGQLFLDFIHPDDLESTVHAISQLSNQQVVLSFTNRYRAKNGEYRWIEWRSYPQGELIYAVARDITERVVADHKRQVSEERLTLAIEGSGVGLWDWNIATDETIYNERWAEIVGYQLSEISNLRSKIWHQLCHPDDLLLSESALKKHFAGETPNYECEIRLLHKSGKWIWVLDRGKITEWDQHGIPTRMTGTHLDITARKHTEEERKNLEERLQRSQKMEALGTLAGGVAHDLNNVLGILVGYSELLIMGLPENNPMRDHAHQILRGGQRAAAIIQDLLTLARRGVAVSQIINLNSIISEFIESPEFESIQSLHPDVQVKTDLDKHLCNTKGSPVHLSKSVMNLLNNAMEAIPDKGLVTIKTENIYVDRPIRGYDHTKEGEYVLLTVTDNGTGISQNDLNRIFEPFYTKKVMGRSGTGLGLAVVWGTVKDHDGYIDVTSEPGIGSTFSLYFPMSREQVTETDLPHSIEEMQGKGEAILVIDDVEGQRNLAAQLLTNLGYEVVTAESGEKAIELVKAKKFDLLVMDMIMDPGIDGLETYIQILKHNPDQKAILVSGFSETERVKRAQQLGAGAYVRKPYLLDRIGMAVKHELSRTRES